MAISSLLRRLGFVRLDAYGLVLTPEDRILSIRATVLDDGLGQKIVGWQEADLAAMELEHWAPKGVAKPPVVSPVSLAPTLPQAAMPPPVPRAKPPTLPPAIPLAAPVANLRPLPGMTTAPARSVAVAVPLQAAPKQQRPPTPLPLETMPMQRVADPTEVGEDGEEWEWEIAVARARAAAEWAAEAAEQAAWTAPPAAPVRKKRATTPIAIVAEPKDWKTEPLYELQDWENSQPVRVMPRVKSPTPARPIVMIPAHTPKPTAAPSVSPRAPLQPIVAPRSRTQTASLPLAPRFPRATPATTPDASLGEDTQVNTIAAPAANDEATRPGLLLPSASSTRRVAAKQR